MEAKTDIEKLREIALDQHGLVTASQAEEAGVSRPALSYLAKHDRITRLERGIYRIPQVVATENDALQQALLWAGDGAYLSHDTALAAWDVCDINPMKIHLTVPKGRRIQKEGHEEIVIHKESNRDRDLKWWDGMPIATPYDAILQTLDRGASSHVIEQAIDRAASRGMISREQADDLQQRLASHA